jgi:hypothetical protein
MPGPATTKLKALLTGDFITGVKEALSTKSPQAELEAYRQNHKFSIAKLPPENSAIFYYKGLEIGSRENVVSITGKAKSRKTVIASALSTAVFKADGGDFLGFSCRLGKGEKVLHIDTEQGYYHYYHSVKRIFDNAGLVEAPDRFESVHTRDASTEFRIELIEYLLEQVRPSVCIIDGVTDLVYDLNSQDEATRVGEKILAWSSKYNALFIVVIHTTKTTGYMTGAIGTYLEKKSETVIKVEKPEDEEQQQYSHISCQYSRNAPFKTFTIEYDEEAGAYRTTDEQAVTTKGKKGDKSPEGYADEVHSSIVKRMYTIRYALNEGEVRQALAKAVKATTGDEIKSRDLKRWIDYYSGKAWIYQDPDGKAWKRVELGGSTTNSQGHLFLTREATSSDPLPHGAEGSPTDDLPF